MWAQKKFLDVSFLMVKSSPRVLYLGKVALINIAEATESAVTFGETICYLSLTLKSALYYNNYTLIKVSRGLEQIITVTKCKKYLGVEQPF